MIQDRNIHRDAQALRKVITVPLVVPAFGTDQDEAIYVTRPRYNWRLSDMSVSIAALSTATMIVKAQAVRGIEPPTSSGIGGATAAGSPQLGQNSAPTYNIEELWRSGIENADGIINNAAEAAVAFSNAGATILDGFWGVFLITINQSGDIESIEQARIMAFATEEIALANCPKVPQPQSPGSSKGRLAILTINAVGGDFIAGTTNTDAGLVAAFNTAPQDGHVANLVLRSNPTEFQSVLGQKLKDASGTSILQGTSTDFLVVTVRSAGSPVLTGPASVQVEYRPWPAGGEGVGDASVSQNRPSFVP